MEKPKKKDNSTLIGAIVGAVLLGIPLLMNPAGGRSGDHDFYAGPVLPMTSLSGGGDLEVTRSVDFDFAPLGEEKESSIDPDLVIVTDDYVLTNPAEETVTAQLVYPFEGQLIDESELIPEITVDGSVIGPEFYAAVDAEERIRLADDWESYRDAIVEEDYLAEAMADAPALSQTVTVCRFFDIRYDGDEPEPFLQVSWDSGIPYWTCNRRVTSIDGTSVKMLFQPGVDGYLIFEGSQVPDLEFGGNRGYNFTANSALEGVSYELETYETTLGGILWELAQDYDYWEDNSDYPNPGLASAQLCFTGAANRIEALGKSRLTNFSTDLDHYFHLTVSDIRMLYFVFPVEIPAGGTVRVTARYHQEGSRDNGGLVEQRVGYDLATRLGSDLNFTAQSASVTNSELVRILRQNFGFDPEQGITQVALDPETERYYMDVASRVNG